MNCKGLNTEDAGLIEDQRSDPHIADLIQLHSQTAENRPEVARLCEILIDERREACAAMRTPAKAEPKTKG